MAEIKSEAELVKRILIECTSEDVRLWRNNVGVLEDRNGRPVAYGLCPGSADIIGIQRHGRFVSIECKWGRAKLKDHQQAWMDMVISMGGLACVAYCVEDAKLLLGQ